MQETNPDLFIFALYILIIAAAVTCIAVIYSLRGHDLPVNSIKLFLAYFVIGVTGWAIQAFNDLTGRSLPLSLSLTSYVVASFILFIAVVECSRNKNLTTVIALFNLAFIITGWMSSVESDTLLTLTIYILITYPVIFIVSVKHMLDKNNIGNGIIALASFLVTAGALLQLKDILIENDPTGAYAVALITAATGFIMVGIGFLTSILINEHHLLSSLALNDPLTGLLNRRGMEVESRIALAAAQRNKLSISMIAVDLDHFKQVNDNYGHDTGDLVLQTVAGILLDSLRESDICCRLGGEEFIILLPETEMNQAMIIGERIRTNLENSKINTGSKSLQVTASFGVSTENEDIEINRLLKAADKALYIAKDAGRNRVQQALRHD